jgi:hypothetical protein
VVLEEASIFTDLGASIDFGFGEVPMKKRIEFTLVTTSDAGAVAEQSPGRVVVNNQIFERGDA